MTGPRAGGGEPKSAIPYLGVVGLVLALDVATKVVVERVMTPYRPIPVLGEFFRLTFIHNPGAAFGLHFGSYSRAIFLALTLVALVVLGLWYRATPAADRLRLYAIALVASGAVGNLIDRIRSPQGVIDFLDIGVGAWRWPIFNVADIAVTTGATLLALSLWREEREADAQR